MKNKGKIKYEVKNYNSLTDINSQPIYNNIPNDELNRLINEIEVKTKFK